MKKIKFILLVALLAVIAIGAISCGKNSGHEKAGASEAKTLYTCGMHPQIIQDHPGNCPICGMKLTPIRKQAGTGAPAERKIAYYKSTMNPGETSPQPGKDSMGMDMVPVYENAANESQTIAIDPATIQTMNIRTAEVTRGPLRRMIRTVANVDYDETALADVTTKYKGWIEKLYVDATGALVNPGNPLFEIYSPELYSAQTEYLAALAGESGSPSTEDRALLESARTKLKFYDISDAQITELEKTRTAKKTLTITAPISGFVVEKNVVAGQMVEAGMKLYRLVDIGVVWVYAQIYEQDLPAVQLGQEATMTLSYLPDRKFRGRVTYVYPTVDEKTRTARVRMEFHNPGYFLKPGMFATVELVADIAPSALLVPDSAVLRSGEKNTVFVALPGGKFEARTIALGLQAQDDMDQVLGGLSEGERIVTSGQFMLDSESQLREAIQKMSNPGESPSAATVPGTSETSSAVPVGTNADVTVWVCPMPEHVSIEYDHPGKCPICSMALVPVTKSLLEKIQPGGKILYYTCPMPEHSDVHSDKPGKCPKCGMTLIPVMSAPGK
ncbi:MAG: efflux RND transporter periplasmic adaptor subunit [Verrucomicrobiota bacterium]|jgi:RND family efflux transporter MFP subunit